MRCIRRNQVTGLLVARGLLLRLPRYALITLLYATLLFSVTACSYIGGNNSSNDAAAAPPPPPTTQQQTATIAPAPTPMDTLRALAPPDGLSFTPLFNQPLSSDSARITRLEHAVQTLSDDINTMAPTVVRMVAIEGDVKGLVKQLQTLTNQNQQSASGTIPTEQQPESPPASAGGKKIPEGDVAKGTEPAKADEAKAGPVASSSLVTPEAASKGQLPPKGAASPISKSKAKLSKPIALTAPKAPPANAVSGSVVNMRIGDWPHKTRLVLDVTAKIPVKMRMINHNKTLVIDLAHLRWGGRDVWASDHTQLITDGHVKDGRLYVNLKRASTYKSLILSPSRSDKNFRLVIDLFDKGL